MLLLVSALHAQDKDWTLGLVSSPNFYSIKSHPGFGHTYHADVGMSIGLESFYSFGNRINLGLGGSLNSLSYQVNYLYTFEDPGDPHIPRSSIKKAVYLDIPLFLRTDLLVSNKMKLYTSLAVNSSFLINSEDQTTFEDNSVRDSGFLNSFLLSSQLGLGLVYKLHPKIGLKFESKFRYYLKGFDVLMNANPSLVQTVIGIEYSLDNKQ